MKKSMIFLIAVPAAILLGGAVFAGVVFLSPKSDPAYVAHRGYSGKFRPNTVAAFEAAAEENFWGIETDIRTTKDGALVCEHDETVKYKDGTELAVASSTLAELRAKPLKNDVSNDDVCLATFEEYLAACKKGNKIAVIELKESCSSEKLREILSVVDEAYDRSKCAFIAFDYGNLTRLKAEDASLSLQYLSETKGDPMFENALADGIAIDVHVRCVTKKLVNRFHKKGVKVNVWTVNDAWSLNKVRRAGVDYVTTDIYTGERA